MFKYNFQNGCYSVRTKQKLQEWTDFSVFISMLSLHTRQIQNFKFPDIWVHVWNQYKNLHNIEYQIVWTHSFNYTLPGHEKLIKNPPISVMRDTSLQIYQQWFFSQGILSLVLSDKLLVRPIFELVSDKWTNVIVKAWNCSGINIISQLNTCMFTEKSILSELLFVGGKCSSF